MGKKKVFTVRHVKGRESEYIGLCKPKRNIWIPLLNKGYVLNRIIMWWEIRGSPRFVGRRSCHSLIEAEYQLPHVVLIGIITIFIGV